MSSAYARRRPLVQRCCEARARAGAHVRAVGACPAESAPAGRRAAARRLRARAGRRSGPRAGARPRRPGPRRGPSTARARAATACRRSSSPPRMRATRRALTRRSSAIAAWWANWPSRSSSARLKPARCGRSSTDSTPRARSSCEQRRGHQALRDVARAPRRRRGRSAGRRRRPPATSGWRVTSTQPAMPVLDGKRWPTQRVRALAGDGLEDELVAVLVEQADRRRPARRKIARATSTIDCSSARCAARRRASARRPRRVALRRSSPLPPTLSASGTARLDLERRQARVLGEDQRAERRPCAASRSCCRSRVIVPPPSQATSTSTPRAKNSTGGAGL